MVAQAFGLEGQVVRIHPDAVAAHQPGAEGQEVPLSARGFQHVQGVNALAVENERQLIHQSDVQITLSVFDHLGGFGGLKGGRDMDSRGDDRTVDPGDQLSCGWQVAGDDFLNLLDGVFAVARVDALRRIAGEKLAPPGEAALPLDHRNAVLFGAPRIHRGLINHGGSRFDMATNERRGLDQGGQVRAMVRINRGGHRHHHQARATDGRRLGGELNRVPPKLFLGQFQSPVLSSLKFLDSDRVDVESQDSKSRGEGHGQRQTHISQPNHTNRLTSVGKGFQCRQTMGLRTLKIHDSDAQPTALADPRGDTMPPSRSTSEGPSR